ncbi:hypothetical protein [Gibbsiella quercinecans]|uniref:hypothetical protein n=1 Tax=Gibbsiella quercinecans TaxID=929813 RepID=UPI00160318C8|nr:hypothetical protein [Gibbsiella quercinecans]
MDELSPKRKETQQLCQTLHQALLLVSPRPLKSGELPPQEQWLTTRSLAEVINEGVYRARTLLLKMVELGDVLVSSGPVKNSLRWYPTALANSYHSKTYRIAPQKSSIRRIHHVLR